MPYMSGHKIPEKISIRVTVQDRRLAEMIIAKLEPTLGKQNVTDVFRIAIRALAAKEGVSV